MEPLLVWLDFDPAGFVWTGLDVDDDLAFLAALALHREPNHPLKIVGVSVTAGNAPLVDTLRNANMLLRHAGIFAADAPSDEHPLRNISKGASWHDMFVPWKFFRALHRGFRSDVVGTPKAAGDAMADAVLNEFPPNTVTVVCLGPLTNLAAALKSHPLLAPRLKRVVLMGGATDGKKLDLNWMSDRAAARLVVNAKVPKVMVPIQTCAQVVVTDELIERFAQGCCASHDPDNNCDHDNDATGCDADDSAGSSADSGAGGGEVAGCALLPKMRLQSRVMPWLVNPHVRDRLLLKLNEASSSDHINRVNNDHFPESRRQQQQQQQQQHFSDFLSSPINGGGVVGINAVNSPSLSSSSSFSFSAVRGQLPNSGNTASRPGTSPGFAGSRVVSREQQRPATAEASSSSSSPLIRSNKSHDNGNRNGGGSRDAQVMWRRQHQVAVSTAPKSGVFADKAPPHLRGGKSVHDERRGASRPLMPHHHQHH